MDAAWNGKRIRAVVVAALSLVMAVALLCAAGCKKEETPSVTLTVACTDEVRQSLADADVTDAEAFLVAAAEKFAAQYTDIDVTINVVSVKAGWADKATLVGKTVGAVFAGGVPAGTAPAAVPASPATVQPADEGSAGVPEDGGEELFLDLGDTGAVALADEPDGEGEGSPDGAAEGEAESEAEPTADAMVDPDPDVDPGIVPPTPSEPAIAAAESVVFATPDVLFGTYDDLSQAVYAGLAVPLDDIVQTAGASVPAPYLEAGRVPQSSHTYLLPFSVSQSVLVIDLDLIEACDLGGYIAVREDPTDDAAQGEADDAAGATEEGEEPDPAEGLYASAEEAAFYAMGTAILQSWTPAEWVDILQTLSVHLPRVAASRLYNATLEWNAAVQAANDQALAAAVAVENARIEGDEEAAAAAAFDLDAALAEIGPKPEYTPLYTMMMVGEGADGSGFASAMMRSFGADFFDGEGYVLAETAEGISAATWLSFLASQGVFAQSENPLTIEENRQLLTDGRLAFTMLQTTDLWPLFLASTEYVEIEQEPYEIEVEVEVEPEPGANGAATGEKQTITTTETVTPDPITGYRYVPRYAFVAVPVFSVSDMQLMAQYWMNGAPEEVEAAEGEGETAPAVLPDTAAGQLIPTEFSGFAVLDKGDDLALTIAKAFVEYVLTEEEWLQYEASLGYVPAASDVLSQYAGITPFGLDQSAIASNTANMSGNVPGWNAAQEALVSAFASVADGSRTPVEVTAAIDKGMNAYIEPAWRAAELHE